MCGPENGADAATRYRGDLSQGDTPKTANRADIYWRNDALTLQKPVMREGELDDDADVL
jgi:hypothetical protein